MADMGYGYPGYGYATYGYPYSTYGLHAGERQLRLQFGLCCADVRSRNVSNAGRYLGIDEEPMVGSDGSKAMKITNVYPGRQRKRLASRSGMCSDQ